MTRETTQRADGQSRQQATEPTQHSAEPQWISTRDMQQAEADVRALYEDVFGAEPVGVWSAPGRVNLIGEHVDYAAGISVPFALSQRTYVAASPNAEGTYRLVSRYAPSASEPPHNVRYEIPVGDVSPGHPANWAGYAVGAIWAAREAGVIPAGEAASSGLDIAIVSDVPVGAGLSSSAALECAAVLAAFDLANGAPTEPRELDDDVRAGLMVASIRAENEVVGASTGGLDQRIALFGKEGHALAIDFLQDSAEQVPFDIASRGLAVLIMNTNAPHQLNDGQYASRRAVIDGVTEDLGVRSLREAQDAVAASAVWAERTVPEGVDADAADVEAWKQTVARRVRHVVSEIERTADAVELLKRGDMDAFGLAMSASHASLRDDYEVTVPELDLAVDTAMACGALGARMTGGGFGGSAIALLDATLVESTAAAVAEAFARAGFNGPEFVVALPSDGAHRHA